MSVIMRCLIGLLLFSSVLSAQAPSAIAIYAHPTTFPDLDPSTAFSNDIVVLANAYETLTFYDNQTNSVLPKLATAWESSEDALTWVFTLREGILFHEGTLFDANAVKFSIERTIGLGLGAAYIFDAVESIEVLDTYSVGFNLQYAAPMDLILATGYGAWMMSPASIADKDSAWFNEGNSAGTGPYRIQRYEPSALLVMEAFQEYWGGWRENQFKTIIFQIVEDPTVLEQLMRSGSATFTHNIPYDNYPALAELSTLRVDVSPAYQTLLGLLNTRREPTNNPLVRQALAYSFPYQAVTQNLYTGYGTQSRGAVPASMWGGGDDIPQLSQDLDRAKSLLAQAGYEGQPLNLLYTHVAGDNEQQQIGELWAADLAKIGVTLEVRGLAWEAQWRLGQSDPEVAQHIFAFYWWPDYITPYSFLFSMFHSEEEPFFNLGYYSNPTFDSLIQEANRKTVSDRDEASKLFVEAQKLLVEDVAGVFMLDLPNIHVIDARVEGYVNNPAYSHVVFWYNLTLAND